MTEPSAATVRDRVDEGSNPSPPTIFVFKNRRFPSLSGVNDTQPDHNFLLSNRTEAAQSTFRHRSFLAYWWPIPVHPARQGGRCRSRGVANPARGHRCSRRAAEQPALRRRGRPLWRTVAAVGVSASASFIPAPFTGRWRPTCPCRCEDVATVLNLSLDHPIWRPAAGWALDRLGVNAQLRP